MNDNRYILASNKVPKLDCPYCGAKKHWQRYIDKKTGKVLPDLYGRCDNEEKCGKWNDPYKMGYAKTIREQEQEIFVKSVNAQNKKYFFTNTKLTPKPEPVSIPVEVLKKTLEPKHYEQNIFIQNLLSRVPFPFETKEIEKVISLYYLGTIRKGYRAGAVTFPFIDINSKIRAIQVKQFNKTNHTKGTDFLHSIIEKWHHEKNKPLPEWLNNYLRNEKYVSCLFGEHLISKYPNNPIGLVESPKTAIYCTLYFGFPDDNYTNILWLAVYNKSSFSFDKLKILHNRDICVFPDLSKDGITFNEWQRKGKEIENRLPGTKFIFSDLLENLAPETDKQEGNDIADFLIKLDWRKFRKRDVQQQETPALRAIEIEQKEECKTHTVKSPDIVKIMPEYKSVDVVETTSKHQTIGDVFDLLKKKYKSLPPNVQINIPGWPGRPFKGRAAIFNKRYN